MRSSSAQQYEIGGLDSEFLPRDRGIVSESAPTNKRADTSTMPPLKIPDFGARGPVFAATAKQAGRVNAANVSEQEHQDLLQERQILLDKLLDGTITRKQENRLAYVRWSLDTIEDAKYGIALDMLESVVSVYEKFASDVSELKYQLLQQVKKRK